jgi:hypothetical protein
MNICIFKHIKSNNTMTVKNRLEKFQEELSVMCQKLFDLEQCSKCGSKKDEMIDALNVALKVRKRIIIPHNRHAFGTIELIENEGML